MDCDLTPETDFEGRWRWLGGPPPFGEAGATPEALAPQLTGRPRTPLSFGEWACVLQWRDRPASQAGGEGQARARRYELSFWVHNRSSRPGVALHPLGISGESALLSGSDPETDRAAMQDAIARLLGRAAKTLDAQVLPTCAPDPLPMANAHPHSPGKPRRTVAAYAAAALIVVLAAIVVQTFVVTPYLIPASSFANTLAPSQRVLVNRVAFRFDRVDRGDVIVVRDSQPPHELALRRVVAVGGDLLYLHDEQLWVNGLSIGEANDAGHGPAALQANGEGMVSWSSLHPYRVPTGDYVVVADGPAVSGDSRSCELVSRRAIVGRVLLMHWPPDLLRHI